MADLNITLIQSDLQWENKAANLAMFGEKMESIREPSTLIILPEMFSTGFSMENEKLAETMEGPTVAWMKKMASAKSAILTGSIIAREESKAGINFFNRLIWMLPDGTFGFYDKRHLFAYGKEDQHYSPGKKRLIASVNGWKVNLQICYDLRFPVWLRQTVTGAKTHQPEYDLLLVVANWPAVRNLAWKTLLQARAIENQCYVVGLNRTGKDGRNLQYTGESMIVGPLGEIIQNLGPEETVFSHTLSREMLEETRKKYPFLRDADSFLIEP